MTSPRPTVTAVVPSDPFESAVDDRTGAFTALLLVVVAFNEAWWPFRALTMSVALLCLLRPRLARSPWPWMAIASGLLAAFALEWWATDNHHLLIALACLLAGLAIATPDPGAALALGARRLILATFVAALVAKIASPDFRSGDFGSVWPALDDRLADLAERVGAIDGGARRTNDAVDATLRASDVAPIARVDRWFATLFTVWTVAIETAVAVGFAVSRRHRLAPLGDAALLIFIVSTYAIVPVLGFAAVLCALGMAQAGGDRRLETLYVLAFAAVPLQDAVARVI